MKNKRLKFNISTILILFVILIILVIGNISVIKLPVATISGSYANEYAQKNNLQNINLSDSNKDIFNLRYETFDADVKGNGLLLNKYNGISEILVIPEEIKGVKVTGLGEKFFDSISSVKEIYVPDTISLIEGNMGKDITLHCSSHSNLVEKYEEKNWQIDTYNDTDIINFSLGDIPFFYNELDGEVELTGYIGNEREIVIPSYIDGKPVRKVSFDMIGSYELVVFPETIEEISGKLSVTLYTTTFMIEMMFIIISFIVVMIVINILIPRYKNPDEYNLSGMQMIMSYIYLLGNGIFAILMIYKSLLSTYIALVINIAFLIAYILIIFLSEKGRSKALVVEKEIKETTKKIRTFKVNCKNMTANIKDPVAKKMVQRLEENIQYSDPRSCDELEEIENELFKAMDSLKDSIELGNAETIIMKANKAQEVLDRRNELCKEYK